MTEVCLYFYPFKCDENLDYPLLEEYVAQASFSDISSVQKKMMHKEKLPDKVAQ